eukprot:3651819-Pyramimonas_sp.AAC.1
MEGKRAHHHRTCPTGMETPSVFGGAAVVGGAGGAAADDAAAEAAGAAAAAAEAGGPLGTSMLFSFAARLFQLCARPALTAE